MSDLRDAVAELLKHRVGELPRQGWLKDNDESRKALDRLARAALQEQHQSGREGFVLVLDGDTETVVEGICHPEQMVIWSDELVDTLSSGGYLRDDLSYGDIVDMKVAIRKDVKHFVACAIEAASPIPDSNGGKERGNE